MTKKTPPSKMSAQKTIEGEDIDQLEEREKNQDESKIEARYMETKEHENTNTIPRRANAEKGLRASR